MKMRSVVSPSSPASHRSSGYWKVDGEICAGGVSCTGSSVSQPVTPAARGRRRAAPMYLRKVGRFIMLEKSFR
jgi:hypothetical protein